MIEKTVALHLFGGFSVKRWNDLVRPMELNEMDRRSFAMMLAYFLGKLEERDGREVDWDAIIFAGVFDLLRKIALSDIKETVHRRIRLEHPEEYYRLNEWVADSVAPMLRPYGLEARFREYLRSGTMEGSAESGAAGVNSDRPGAAPGAAGAKSGGPGTAPGAAGGADAPDTGAGTPRGEAGSSGGADAPDTGAGTPRGEAGSSGGSNRPGTPYQRAVQILEAARSYSSYREFQIIKGVNAHDPRIPSIETHLRRRMEPYLDLAGMRQLILELDLYRVISVADRLRYQTRWSRTPRIPETAVLGHSLMVATFSLLLTEQRAPCATRRFNNFFGGLFHDLPESVTRDIVAPTKSATPGLPEVVKQIEDETVAEEIYPHMTSGIAEEVRYFIEDEFKSKIYRDGAITSVGTEAIDSGYNRDIFRPIDGELIRIADEFAAFLEAQQSIQLGVASQILIEGANRLHHKYTSAGSIAGVATREMFEQLPFRQTETP